MSKAYFAEKVPCRECGELCFKLCYVQKNRRDILVCVDCFKVHCDAAQEKVDANKKGLEQDAQTP